MTTEECRNKHKWVFNPFSKELIDNMLEDFSSQQKWISVTERLPEVSTQEKLVKVWAFSTVIGQTTAYYWGPDGSALHGWDCMGITHWQPLPSPPKQ